ncbi:MAG: hypothetical protein R3186_10560 [Ruegeria sp.]|nr:hypothetical protein [Ruegeria sp.]
MSDELSFLEQIYKASPAVFALVVFFGIMLILYRAGLLSMKDPTETRWRERMEERMNELERHVAVLDDRWDRK